MTEFSRGAIEAKAVELHAEQGAGVVSAETCNCATYGSAQLCPHHTQADFEAADRAETTTEDIERLAYSKDVRVYGDYASGWRDGVLAAADLLATGRAKEHRPAFVGGWRPRVADELGMEWETQAVKYEALIDQLIHKCARLQGIPVEHERLNWGLPVKIED